MKNFAFFRDDRWNVIQGQLLPDGRVRESRSKKTLDVPAHFKRVHVGREWLLEGPCKPALDRAMLRDLGGIQLEKWMSKANGIALTISEWLSLPTGRPVEVLMLDRNVYDRVQNCSRGALYPPEQMFANAKTTLIPASAQRSHGFTLLALRRDKVDEEKDNDFWIFEFQIEFAPEHWYPLRQGMLPVSDEQTGRPLLGVKQHWSQFDPQSTRIGWRGPMVLWTKLADMPPVYRS